MRFHLWSSGIFFPPSKSNSGKKHGVSDEKRLMEGIIASRDLVERLGLMVMKLSAFV
jgi:hypothetical protein